MVLGAPSGERHALPVSFVADLVRLAGWEVSDLGADTPGASFARAASAADDVVAVGVSVTTAASLEAAAEALAAVRAADPTIALIVGGGAIADADHARSLGADHFAADARSMVSLLDEVVGGRTAGVG